MYLSILHRVLVVPLSAQQESNWHMMQIISYGAYSILPFPAKV
jgi:hypothetical protein